MQQPVPPGQQAPLTGGPADPAWREQVGAAREALGERSGNTGAVAASPGSGLGAGGAGTERTKSPAAHLFMAGSLTGTPGKVLYMYTYTPSRPAHRDQSKQCASPRVHAAASFGGVTLAAYSLCSGEDSGASVAFLFCPKTCEILS